MINVTDSRTVRIAWDQVIDKENPQLVPVFREAAAYMGKFSKAPFKIDLVGTEWAEGEFGNVDWYLGRAKRDGRYCSEDLFSLLQSDPKQSVPHYDIFVISGELTLEGHCLLGASDCRNSAIQSVGLILDEIKSIHTTKLMVFASLAHEIGHVMGLLPETAPNHDLRAKSDWGYAWMFEGHCMHPYCLMQQTFSIEEIEGKLNDFGRLDLCSDCQQILASGV